ncbi:globin domain-containing protein [Derxia lacustris]|uniref:globin domain-containing protein n=1 Tax=Derxia lacustris TaxID=764842 RepID=UPI002E26324C
MTDNAQAPADTIYARLGGAAGIQALVDRFYAVMDELPEAYGIRKMHPDLPRANESLFKFLSGWFGGPPLFEQERGHPRLRARHFPFRIGPAERDQWMLCMRTALEEQVPDLDLRGAIHGAFEGMATHIINTEAPKPPPPPLVENELDVIDELARPGVASIIELGCGAARVARELLDRHAGAHVTALEVDAVQHARNLAEPRKRLQFIAAGAQAIPCADASFDLALMLKSLHHVPVPLMGTALAEVARVVKPGGQLYVSEPMYEGPFNDIVKLYNDEGEVRAAAQAALDAALESGAWTELIAGRFDAPRVFASFAEFEARMMRPSFADHQIDAAKLAEVRAAFEPHLGPDGARFRQPMIVRLLLRAGGDTAAQVAA